MVRKNDKLKQILDNELSAGLDITNMKYYHNNSDFTRIFNTYNEGLPNCLRMKNCMRRRKMVLKQMERIQLKKIKLRKTDLNYSSNTENIQNNSISNLERAQLKDSIGKQALQELNPDGNDTLQEMEISALEILMNFNTNPSYDKHSTPQYGVLHVSNPDQSLKKQTSASNNQRDQKYSENFVDGSSHLNERQRTVYNVSEKVHYGANARRKEHCGTNYLTDRTERVCNLDKTMGSSQRNFKNKQDKTFDSCKVLGNTDIVSKIREHRKKNNATEKKRIKILRGERKRLKALRKFVYYCNDCSFSVDPIKVFNSKDDQQRKVDYIRKEYSHQNNVCILALYDQKHLRNSYVAYFTCMFPRCCAYRFEITLDGHTVVDRSGDICHAKDLQYVTLLFKAKRSNENKSKADNSGNMDRNGQKVKGSDDSVNCVFVENVKKLDNIPELKRTDVIHKKTDSSKLESWQINEEIGQVFPSSNPVQNVILEEMELSAIEILLNFNTNACDNLHSTQYEVLHMNNPDECFKPQIQNLDCHKEQGQICAENCRDCSLQLNKGQNVHFNIPENVHCRTNLQTTENGTPNFLIDNTETVYVMDETIEALKKLKKSEYDNQESLKQVNDHQPYYETHSRNFENNQNQAFNAYEISDILNVSTTECKTETFDTIKSECLLDHKNASLDIFYMKEGPYENYVHHLISPYTVYMWIPETFAMLITNDPISLNTNHALVLVASGMSICQIESAEKRILIYRMAIRIKSLQKFFVITDAILLSRHTSENSF